MFQDISGGLKGLCIIFLNQSTNISASKLQTSTCILDIQKCQVYNSCKSPSAFENSLGSCLCLLLVKHLSKFDFKNYVSIEFLKTFCLQLLLYFLVALGVSKSLFIKHGFF